MGMDAKHYEYTNAPPMWVIRVDLSVLIVSAFRKTAALQLIIKLNV